MQTASEISFILPDCVALGFDKRDGFQSLMGAGLKDVEAVLMPLSPTRMLVGLRPGASFPNLHDFNSAAALRATVSLLPSLNDDQFKGIAEVDCNIDFRISWKRQMGSVFTQFAKERGLSRRRPRMPRKRWRWIPLKLTCQSPGTDCA